MAYLNGEEILFGAKVNVRKNGAEIVNTLDGNDTDKAPSVAAVNAGLAKKLDADLKEYSTKRLYGRDKLGNPETYGVGSTNLKDYVAMWTTEGNTNANVDRDAYIITGTPKKPYHAATKKYVDDNVDPIIEQLGGFIGTKTVYGGREYGGFRVPDNAYPTVYLSDPSFTAINANGETAYAGRATRLIFRNGNGKLGEEYIEDHTNPSCFVTLPEGTNTIALNIEELTDGIWDGTTLHYWGYALFQVRGGAVDSGIEAALDNIIDIQNSLIGGDSE